MKVNFGISIENKTESKTGVGNFYPNYLFRITSGNSPLQFGSWSDVNPLDNATGEIYVSPCMYSWIGHYFKSETDRIFAISRPGTLSKLTMCCGINSHYHFIHTKYPKYIPKMKKAVINHDYKDKDLQRLFKEHSERVMKRFGKKLSEMKGGEYLGTLDEFDHNHPKDAYPEIIIDPRLLNGCSWEELEHLGKGVFKGKKSKKTFRLEQSIPNPGERYTKPDSEVFK